MNKDTATKLIMLNIAQDGAWVCFALLMMAYFDVPWYIVGVPILINISMFLYGAILVRNYNRINPRNDDREIVLTDNVQEIDDLLYNISVMNPEEIQ